MAEILNRKPSESTPLQLQRLAIRIAGEGQLRITVNGESMLPSFHPGDALLVDSKSRTDLSVGHIITFLNGDTMVTHRIVGRSHRSYLAKGDNSYTFDPIVEPGQVVGRVIAIQHGGNWRAVRLSAGSKFVAAASRMDGRFYEVVAGVDQGIGRIIRRFVHGIFKILIRSISVIFSGRERVI